METTLEALVNGNEKLAVEMTTKLCRWKVERLSPCRKTSALGDPLLELMNVGKGNYPESCPNCKWSHWLTAYEMPFPGTVCLVDLLTGLPPWCG